MRKALYMLILMLVILLTGCGRSAVAEGTKTAVSGGDAGNMTVQTELPDMGAIHLKTEDAPGGEYMAGQICIDWVRDDGDAVNGSAENVAELTLPVEVKLRGNSTREVDKKAYTIKFEVDESLLGMEPGRKWALVSNPFDKSLIRPAVGLAYAQALGVEYTPDFRLCKVWLNDEYMGIYTAMEPVEAGEGRVEECDFLLERNIGRYEDDKTYIDSSLGLRFEFNEPDEPDEMQIEHCYELLAAAEEAICSKNHEQYEQFIDVQSFVDFYIVYELIKDVDFGEYSTRYYFRDGIMYAGSPWDLDLTMGNVSADKEEFKYAAYNNADGAGDESGDSTQGLWASAADYYYWLCRDPWFMELVQQRWRAVRDITENLAVDNELGINLIDRYIMAYEDELNGNFHDGSFVDEAAADGAAVNTGVVDNSWSVSEPAHMSEWQEPADTYAENVEMLRVWLIKRASYLDSQLGPYLYTPALAVQ